jgi:hypothetical protein
MHFITLAPVLLLSSALAGPTVERGNYNDMDDNFNIFKDANSRFEGAICKSQITTKQFPSLVIPPNFRGGCVRCLSIPSLPFPFPLLVPLPSLPPHLPSCLTLANIQIRLSRHRHDRRGN